MARIKVTGLTEPIEVTKQEAEKIKLVRFGSADGKTLPKSKTTDVVIGTWTGVLGDIKWIDTRGEAGASNHDMYVRSLSDDHEKYREDMVRLPAKERAKKTGRFKLFWYTLMGLTDIDKKYLFQKPDPKNNKTELKFASVREMAERTQELYFEKNPRRVHCPIASFKWMLNQPQIKKEAYSRKLDQSSLAAGVMKSGFAFLEKTENY